eukprot:5082665-Amphidinium_carterae.1
MGGRSSWLIAANTKDLDPHAKARSGLCPHRSFLPIVASSVRESQKTKKNDFHSEFTASDGNM